MNILSATHSTFVKRVLPFVVVAGACAWVYWSKRNEADSLFWSLFTLAIGTLIMFFTLRKGFWRMADTVEDHGNHLVVTRWRTTIEIPLSHVREIMRLPKLVGSEVIIILQSPCALGSEICFLAPDKRKVPEIDQVLDALSRRVASQSTKHVA